MGGVRVGDRDVGSAGVSAIPGVSDEAEQAARRRLAPKGPPAPAALTSVPARRGARVVVVAGPGVVASAGAVRALRTFAGITGATVVNTVGAKGLFAWDDPLHGGTIGLQEGDAALAEVPTADLVVTTGLDPAESASLSVALAARAADDAASVVDVHPAHLALAAGGWPPATEVGPRPGFYDAVAAVAGPMYAAGPDAAGRVPPPRAASDLARALPEDGLVVAPPGPTGFWIGRTFPTRVAGSVVIPTGDPPGTGTAVAVLAARAGRPTTLVVPADGVPAEAVGVARDEGMPLIVEVWDDERPAPSDATGISEGVRHVAVDGTAIDALVVVGGPPDQAIWPAWQTSPTRRP